MPTSGALSLDIRLFALTFAAIFVAELPDKTALATMVLASRRRPSAVFAGAAAAFAVQSAVAVAFGGLLSRLPPRLVRAGAGILFLVFAVAMWRGRPEPAGAAPAADHRHFWKTAATSFLVIFAAEWGDLTQLATAALAARYGRPLTIFLSATAALWTVTALATALGGRLGRAFDPRRLEKSAAAAFAVLGAYFLLAG
ncbi:MAG: TMEM165/GDT1 family protein [Elusimicrobia bacterium]|nr:TMEM165/GDT1 family protein [Elusimicrobiota bacterium]